MQDTQQSVMIALLPTTTDWCHIALPHLTLVYVGEIPDLMESVQNFLAKDAFSIAMTNPPLTLTVLGEDVLGKDDNKVEVLLLEKTSQLAAMRAFVEHWNGSDFQEFLPHVTVGPIGSIVEPLPWTLIFDRIMLAWGDNHLTFRLNP